MLSADRAQFRRRLLRWYDHQRRDLPWRVDRDPYRVWVSEIMLQQTRVAAVLDHYARFLHRFPDVHALARAPLASVLAAWSGLGYYRRSRLMYAAARQIVRERAGRFPQTSADWRQLAGIGRYTAAAIASIAFNESCAVVDGNVQRVLQRLAGIAPRDCWTAAQQLLSRTRPGDFNQAMMELGATICLPGIPKCDACPVRRWCGASSRPVVPASTTATRRLVRQAVALVVDRNKVLLLRRAKDESLMPGMWELPSVSSVSSVVASRVLFTLRHSITNTDHLVTVVASASDAHPGARWFTIDHAAQLPLTGLARKILRRARLLPNQY